MTTEQSAQYWASVEVPYKPFFYAFEETLATFEDDPGSPPIEGDAGEVVAK